MNDQIMNEESVEIDNKLVEDIIEVDKNKLKNITHYNKDKHTLNSTDISYGMCPRDDAPDFCQCPCCSNCRPIKARKCCNKCTRTSSTQNPNICKYCMLITTDRKCPFLQHKDIRDMLCHGHSYSDSEGETTPPVDPLYILAESLQNDDLIKPFSLRIPPSFLEDKPKSLLDPKYKRNPTNLKDLLDLYTYNSVEKNLKNISKENEKENLNTTEEIIHSDILLEKLGKIDSNNESEDEESNDDGDEDDDNELIDPEISNLLKQNPPNNLFPYSSLLSDENMNDDDNSNSPFHTNWDNSCIYNDLQFNMLSGVCKASISVEDLGIDEVYNKFMNKVSKFISDELKKEVNDDQVGIEIENKVGKFEPED